MADHDDHIHVGFRRAVHARPRVALLEPGQWIRLIERLGSIDNPTVAQTPSKYARQHTAARQSLTSQLR